MSGNSGPVCKVCGSVLTPEQTVACPSCDTPHHRDCWRYFGGCSVYGCRSRKAAEAPGLRREATRVPAPWPVAGAAQADGKTSSPDKAPAPAGGAPGEAEQVGLAMATAPDLADVVGGARGVVRMDLSLPFESGLYFAAGMGGVAAIAAEAAHFHGFAAPAVVLSLLALLVRLFVDCSYAVDGAGRAVWYYRRILGLVHVKRLCGFEDVPMVSVRGVHGEGWFYAVVLVVRGVGLVEVTDREASSEGANARGRGIASYLGVPFVPGTERSERPPDEVARACGAAATGGTRESLTEVVEFLGPTAVLYAAAFLGALF